METPMLFPITPDDYWKKLEQIIEASISRKLSQGTYPTPPNGLVAKPLLSIKEVCNLFQITKPTIYDWIKHEKLKPYKIRARVYFMMSDIENLLKQVSVVSQLPAAKS
jgi:excisionase family DNA binding protein